MRVASIKLKRKTVGLFTIHKEETEADLIRKCQNQHPVAQRKVYERYAPKMLALCRRYLRTLEDAEEVMSQGFIKVFGKIDAYRSEGSFEGWIRTIMVREALMHLRAKKNFIHFTDEMERFSEQFEVQPTQDMDAEYLIALIDQLPPGYRTVFNMYAIDGYKHHEIAEILGISENTSKTQLMRARALLKDLLDKRKNNFRLN
jgi:RNA polymerase sigma factor (sigma-70 family)